MRMPERMGAFMRQAPFSCGAGLGAVAGLVLACGRFAHGTRRGWRGGMRCLWRLAISEFELRHVDPAPLLPACERAFDKLHALRPLEQVPAVGGIPDDVANEGLPLQLEAVVEGLRLRHRLPALVEVDRLLDVRVPHRPWRRDPRLANDVLKA